MNNLSEEIKLGLEHIKQSKATIGLEDLATTALKYQSFVEIYDHIQS